MAERYRKYGRLSFGSASLKSAARRNQQLHWERKGQICRLIGLISYMLSNDRDMPAAVRVHLQSAQQTLRAALARESKNNEFLGVRR